MHCIVGSEEDSSVESSEYEKNLANIASCLCHWGDFFFGVGDTDELTYPIGLSVQGNEVSLSLSHYLSLSPSLSLSMYSIGLSMQGNEVSLSLSLSLYPSVSLFVSHRAQYVSLTLSL